MSTKSTILLTPYCHIYYDYAYQHTSNADIDGEMEAIVIEVCYGYIDYEKNDDQSVIVVERDSDFAKMIVWMCEVYKDKHDKVEDVNLDEQPEALRKILGVFIRLGNDVKMVNDVLTIRAK